MRRAIRAGFHSLLAAAAAAFGADGNRLAYLDSDDPFYPHRDLARLITPQWIGEPGVDAAVIISIDDLREPAKYEAYLRPILERLKAIDDRAPVSIFCNQLNPDEPQFQAWLKEGVSLEVHTLTHPCPLLGKGGFDAAAETYHGGVDLLAKIPSNTPVAFRMPCCDSMNSASPRFYAEIFSKRSKEGRTLAIDSSVFNIFTPRDKSLPRELVTTPDGADRFRKYFPMEMRPPTKLTFERFAGYIEDYPYPYVIGGRCWELPCTVPSDWEAFNAIGPKDPRTTEDWKAALDLTVIKQGVMTMVLHPHGWSDPAQIVDLIDHAVTKHGTRVKFLSMREALERLEKNVLGGQTLRAEAGGDNGVRLLDVNGDGFMDVVIGNEVAAVTRVWDANGQRWTETATPARLTLPTRHGARSDMHVRFGAVQKEGSATMLQSASLGGTAWHFRDGSWREVRGFFRGVKHARTLDVAVDGGVRLRDFDGDGVCELLVSRLSDMEEALRGGASVEPDSHAKTNTIHRWSEKTQAWEPADYRLPDSVWLLDDQGRDNGLRFIDLNSDGSDDVLYSNEKEYGIWLWAKNVRDDLGWKRGWSHTVIPLTRRPEAELAPSALLTESREGEGSRSIPPITRSGRNNGAWFKDGHLVIQNEETAHLPNVVWRRSFKDLIAFEVPEPKSPEASLKCLKPRPGFTVELVAAEPLVVDPIAFEWDAHGRLWVVEMRDYPLGIDGKGKPGGVIKVLEDTDSDGRHDKSTPFLENVPFPTGVMPWRDGVLIAASPDIIFAEDRNGDGRADHQQVLFTGFKEGNQQHRVNGFEWGLDGWVYGANGDSGGDIRVVSTAGGKPAASSNAQPIRISGRDFRFRPDTGEFQTQAGQTQYGRRRDDWGNWFGNNNPNWLWHYPIPEQYVARNPKLAVKSMRRFLANDDTERRVFPISAAPIRFNHAWAIGHVTSACSPAPYRDELFGAEFVTSVFVAEPVHNAVHREVLQPDGASFKSGRAADEKTSEFLASTDTWFRPTMLKTGPDGALYIADMYRFVLEHPEWIAPETQARIDLRAGEDKGRIYRVFPKGATLRPAPRLAALDSAALVAALDSPSGWQRDTAQRLLTERADRNVADALAKLAASATNPKVRIQALSALDTIGVVNATAILTALRDSHPAVRATAIRLAEQLAGTSGELLPALVSLLDDPDAGVRYQLAFSLGAWRGVLANDALNRLAARDGTDELMRTAILSSVAPDHPLMATLRDEKAARAAAAQLPKLAAKPDPDRGKVAARFLASGKLAGDATRGREVFRQACAICHRLRGEGHEVGPDLGMTANKPLDWLLTAIFDPNAAIEARYEAYAVQTHAGAESIGIIAAETVNNLTLRLPGGAEQTVLRDELKSAAPLGRSLMPAGLEASLTPEALADLLAYLRNASPLRGPQ